ncbi:MAG TPA: ribosome biogenesis GTPase Der [Firmicutes bacterium]|nr:ribosome biogenesis GTPase Der [Bacillota bacterium]
MRGQGALPQVAIVGRPNVGKSTLFNQILSRRAALVRAEPGITRDRLYGEADWRGRHFVLVDTGGIDPDSTGEIPRQMLRQAELAAAEADLVLFVVDARAGLLPADEEVAERLRQIRKNRRRPVLLVVNKVDGPEIEPAVWEFTRLGLGEPFPVAAEHARGLGDLLDAIIEHLPAVEAGAGSRTAGRAAAVSGTGPAARVDAGAEASPAVAGVNAVTGAGTVATRGAPAGDLAGPDDNADTADSTEVEDLPRAGVTTRVTAAATRTATESRAGGPEAALAGAEPEAVSDTSDTVAVAVVGRPNVGKSSLVNRILGEERVIVSSIPGTTRDPVDTPFTYAGRPFLLVDTAGLRRPGRVDEPVEKVARLMAERALARADIALLVLDAAAGITHQDLYVGGLIREAARGALLVANKWDLVAPGEPDAARRFEAEVRRKFDYLGFAPLVFISARTGRGLPRLLEQLLVVTENYSTRLSPDTWHEILAEATAFHQPPTRKGRPLVIYSAEQVGVRPPTVLLRVNDPRRLHFSYLRYLENMVRRVYPFTGAPIRWKVVASPGDLY